MPEELKCNNCDKRAKFIDSDLEPYCSKKCYLKKWGITPKKITERTIYLCSNCDEVLESCNQCKKELDEDTSVCDQDMDGHYCSEECLFKAVGWKEIEKDG